MRASSSRRPPASSVSIRVWVESSVAVLADQQVGMTLRRDLRQVGDAQNLALFAQRAQFLPDHFGHGATDAGVDLVEDHAADGVLAQRGDFDRQADARQFTAGGDLAQRRVAAGPGWR